VDSDLEMSGKLIDALTDGAVRIALQVWSDPAFVAWAKRWLSREVRDLSGTQRVRAAAWAESVQLGCGPHLERSDVHRPFAGYLAASCAAHALEWHGRPSFSEASAVAAIAALTGERAVQAARCS
jgi:hypothetical protein